MSSQTDWMVGCFLSAQWKLQYATLMVVMQILHYPMALWYLGARSYCILQFSPARVLCVKVLSLPVQSLQRFMNLSDFSEQQMHLLECPDAEIVEMHHEQLFRTSWWMCVGVRAACMLLSAYTAFEQGDVTASVLLTVLFLVFSWLVKLCFLILCILKSLCLRVPMSHTY